jgi:hypothetical protein
MEILNSVMTWLMNKRYHQIEAFMQNPHAFQEIIFQNLVSTAKDTEWGLKWGYKDIKTVEQFRERVPVSPYETLHPYIERLMKGEQNLLWPGQTEWFAKSSGTTNDRSKFIPVTKESLEDCHFKAGKDMLALWVHSKPETTIFKGKILSIGGSLQTNPHNSATRYGDVSAIITQNLPVWAQMMRTPTLEIALMTEWEAKIEQMALHTMSRNVTCIAGVPTWTYVLFQKILEISGKNTIADVWPDLEVFYHGAVAFGPYRSLFKSLIPTSHMAYMETYNASEGFFGIQDDLSLPDQMLLMLDYGVFYEFIPMDELGKDHPAAVGLHEVELGKNYALVISTNAGLWRYLIGDTVRFTSLAPFRFKISGRTKHFINAFGEEIVVENAEAAITEACQATGATMSNFTAAPIYLSGTSKGGHEWIVEFKRAPDSMDAFALVLDKTLREVNSDYDAKRYKDMALVMPVVHSVPEGTFYNWMKKRGKLGSQHKVPRLSNSREYLDDILDMLQAAHI